MPEYPLVQLRQVSLKTTSGFAPNSEQRPKEVLRVDIGDRKRPARVGEVLSVELFEPSLGRGRRRLGL